MQDYTGFGEVANLYASIANTFGENAGSVMDLANAQDWTTVEDLAKYAPTI